MPHYSEPAASPRIRALCCDLDDTLFDHAGATRRSLAEIIAADACAATWELDEVVRRHAVLLEEVHAEVLAGRATIRRARLERFRRLLESFDAGDPDRAERWASAYRDAYERHGDAVAGALDLLTAARDAGVRVAIVTNNVRRKQVAKLRQCGLEPFVDALITSEEVGVPKPGAEIFVAALEQVQVEAAETVMLGDAWEADIEGARAAGLHVVWFNPTGKPSPDPSVPELRALTPVDAALTRLGIAAVPAAT